MAFKQTERYTVSLCDISRQKEVCGIRRHINCTTSEKSKDDLVHTISNLSLNFFYCNPFYDQTSLWFHKLTKLNRKSNQSCSS